MPKTLKVATLDTYFREAVQAATESTCQFRNAWYKGAEFQRCPECGNQPGGGDDVAHFYGRRYRAGRWWPDNVAMLCRKAHSYIDAHEPVKVGFFGRLLGEEGLEELVKRMHGSVKYTPADRWDIGQHYKEEKARIEEERKNGKTGTIKLISYE